MDVARVLERLSSQRQLLRRNDERIALVATRRAVGPDLIVERDDVVTVERSEQHAVAGVGLPDQRLHRAQHVWLGAEYLERIFARHDIELGVAENRPPVLPRQNHTPG